MFRPKQPDDKQYLVPKSQIPKHCHRAAQRNANRHDQVAALDAKAGSQCQETEIQIQNEVVGLASNTVSQITFS